MALSKTANTSLVASVANTAGSTTNSSNLSLTGNYATAIYFSMVNGGTGPTIPCAAVLQVSYDGGTTYIEYQRLTAGTVASTTYSGMFVVPLAVCNVRLQFTGNTGQSVTVAAWYDKVTSL
jgi:hypothetical protein